MKIELADSLQMMFHITRLTRFSLIPILVSLAVSSSACAPEEDTNTPEESGDGDGDGDGDTGMTGGDGDGDGDSGTTDDDTGTTDDFVDTSGGDGDGDGDDGLFPPPDFSENPLVFDPAAKGIIGTVENHPQVGSRIKVEWYGTGGTDDRDWILTVGSWGGQDGPEEAGEYNAEMTSCGVCIFVSNTKEDYLFSGYKDGGKVIFEVIPPQKDDKGDDISADADGEQFKGQIVDVVVKDVWGNGESIEIGGMEWDVILELEPTP